ncbi:trifunctional thioredoxin/methionine sulfoxide reductase A/B protein [Neisseria gonorrhoeae]|nr:trifunctional thioredoxin/methionine sulfoxide reductase A/B protein [Neisseria gonorrhoeae]
MKHRTFFSLCAKFGCLLALGRLFAQNRRCRDRDRAAHFIHVKNRGQPPRQCLFEKRQTDAD